MIYSTIKKDENNCRPCNSFSDDWHRQADLFLTFSCSTYSPEINYAEKFLLFQKDFYLGIIMQGKKIPENKLFYTVTLEILKYFAN